MILVNVLSMVALASSVIMLMISAQDFSTQRSLRFREASQAAIIARAGEMSAAVALRRDAEEAPQADHLREPWAAVAQRGVRITGGTFELSVSDAQARFNLNNLADGGLSAVGAIPIIAEMLGIDQRAAEAVAVRIQRSGPLTELSQLSGLGLDEASLARLSGHVTLLPRATSVNINSASEATIALFTGNPAAARSLVLARARTGFVTEADLRAAGLSLPPGMGFTSDHYWVRTTVSIGDTTQVLTSLVQRLRQPDGIEVSTLSRWRGVGPPDQLTPAPDLPAS